MKKIITLTAFCFFLLAKQNTFSQSSIHYYGWNSQYNLSPYDIIKTADGGFLLMGDVASSLPLIENPVFKQYLVKTNTNGDTLWTKYHKHKTFGAPRIIETSSNNFISFSQIDGGYACGSLFASTPYRDYSMQTFSSNGDSLSLNQYNDTCDDFIVDVVKNTLGGMTVLMDTHRIKEISQSGVINTISLPYNYVTQIEKANNGYWLARYNNLYKISSNGTSLWQNPIAFSPYLADFCKINNDSLIFACSSVGSVTSYFVNVMKTDSFGNQAWNKKYYLQANNIMQHSSGNYVLTGREGNNLKILALNINGDSIWGKTYSLLMPALGIKTVETNNGGLAILARSGGTGMASQYALIIDSIGSTVGIEESHFSNNEISIYPNPTTGVFSVITNETKQTQLIITNILGELIYSTKMNSEKIIIDLSKQAKGIYFIKVNTELGSSTKKLIVE